MGDTLAAIDVGTNSLHLVVARVTGHDRFDVIESVKEMVRLGRGGGDMKVLSPEAMDRAIAALARFHQIADIHGAPIRAVATSATREALNHETFLERARDEAGVELEVISGIEEARLIHLGVLQTLPVFDQTILLCDIGGGSTELVLGRAGEVLASRSFKLGTVRLTDRFFTGERVKGTDITACRSYVRSLVTVFRKEIEAHGFEVAIGSSVRESRLPVGSSANTICGWLARARATATRCCWPPESSLGRCFRRDWRPTVSITWSTQARSGLRPASADGSVMFS